MRRTESAIVFESGVESERPVEEHIAGIIPLVRALRDPADGWPAQVEVRVLIATRRTESLRAMVIPTEIVAELGRRGGYVELWFNA